MRLSDKGNFIPEITPVEGCDIPPITEKRLLRVCPFSNETRNEDNLGAMLFADAEHRSPGIGRFIQCYVGRVTDQEIYKNSSSGGLSRWLLAELLERGKVDYVVNVVARNRSSDADPLFEYAIHESPAEVLRQSAKSAYSPVELSNVLRRIGEQPGRYAVTGVPCFIKALRSIALEDPIYAERIKYTCGVICGHQKSIWYAEMIAWQLGVPPENLAAIDFRVKISGAKANEKGVQAWSMDGRSGTGPKIVQKVFGTTYAHGFFKNPACEFCDDVTAELADISFGDAWLPDYLKQGTSLVIVRNPEIQELVQDGIARTSLQLKEISALDAEVSQAGGLRDRREGLSYRLAMKDHAGLWAPKKRVASSMSGIPRQRRKIYRMRSIISSKSFEYFSTARRHRDWKHFETRMLPLLKAYSIAHIGVGRLFRNRFLKVIKLFAGWLGIRKNSSK